MIDVDELRGILKSNLDCTANWRRRFPRQTSGAMVGEAAALRLEGLGNALRSRSCENSLRRIARLCADADDRMLLKYSEVEADLLREVGVSANFQSAEDYLATLLKHFREARSAAPKSAQLTAKSPARRKNHLQH